MLKGYSPISWAIIGSDYGSPPGRRQAIIWINADCLLFAKHLLGPEEKPWTPVLVVWSSWGWRWRSCDFGGESYDHHGTPPHLWVLGRREVTSSSPSESPWLPSKIRPAMQMSTCDTTAYSPVQIRTCDTTAWSPVWMSICDTTTRSVV